MFDLVHVGAFATVAPISLALDKRHTREAHFVSVALAAENRRGVIIGATGLLAAPHEPARAVGVFVINFEMVKYISSDGRNLASADRDGFEGRRVSHGPTHPVHGVDRLFNQSVPSQPAEIVPIAELPFQIAHARRAIFGQPHWPGRAGIIRRIHRANCADVSVMNPLKQSAFSEVVTPAEAGHQGQLLLLGGLDRFQNRTNTGRICCHRFLAKDVFSGGNCRLQVHGPKSGRRGQHNDIHSAVDHLLICVQPDKPVFVIDLDLGRFLFLQRTHSF